MVDIFATVQSALQADTDNPARITRSLGGQAANVAAWVDACDCPAHLIAAVGEDPAGEWVRQQFASGGVETTLVPVSEPTGECIVISAPGGSRTMLPASGANAQIAAVGVEARVRELNSQGPTHLHVSGYVLLHDSDFAQRLCTLGAKVGASTSLDCAAVDDPRRWPGLHDLGTPAVDVLLGTVPELSWLLSVPTIERDWHLETDTQFLDHAWAFASAVRAMNDRPPLIIVKLGAHGSLVIDEDSVDHVAVPTVAVVDTTGAGDAFTAGFLAAWTLGESPVASARAGTATAVGAISRLGAGPGPREGQHGD